MKAAQLTHRLRKEDLQAQIGYAEAVTGLEQATGNLLEARGFSGLR